MIGGSTSAWAFRVGRDGGPLTGSVLLTAGTAPPYISVVDFEEGGGGDGRGHDAALAGALAPPGAAAGAVGGRAESAGLLPFFLIVDDGRRRRRRRACRVPSGGAHGGATGGWRAGAMPSRAGTGPRAAQRLAGTRTLTGARAGGAARRSLHRGDLAGTPEGHDLLGSHHLLGALSLARWRA